MQGGTELIAAFNFGNLIFFAPLCAMIVVIKWADLISLIRHVDHINVKFLKVNNGNESKVNKSANKRKTKDTTVCSI